MKKAHEVIEPTAEHRMLARNVVGLYIALIQEGMPPEEARDWIARWAAHSGSGDDE